MELSRWSGDDYINEGVLRAIDVALEITGADKANTLGFSCPCSGPALRHDTRKTVWFANVRAWPVRVYRHNAHQTKKEAGAG